MGVREIRLKRDGPSITLRGRVELVRRSQQVAKAQMDGRGFRRRFERPLDELHGASAVAPVMRDETEKVQSFAAVGRRLQDLAINRFSLIELACLVMGNPGFQVGYGRNFFRTIAAPTR